MVAARVGSIFRQFHTFGNDSGFVAEVAAAYIEGFQLDAGLGPTSVAAMTKHFPGGGPQLSGEDAQRPRPVIFSTAIFPWAGFITDALHETSMEVDWVRVWKQD